MESVPFFPWVGGKRRLAKHIIPLFTKHTCYVEVFAGAAAIFFLKEPSKVEILNDLNGELINLYRVVQHHLEEFFKQFKWVLPSRKIYGWLQDTPPETLTDIQRAARFYYLQKTSFGGKVGAQSYGTATTSPARLNLLRFEEELSAAHLRLARVQVENLDWRECLRRYDRPHTLFYLDPPYMQAHKGQYGVTMRLEEYAEMGEIVRGLKGKAVVSVCGHDEMRASFKGLPMKTVDVKYSVNKDKLTARKELVIWKT
jgi:DNA adenine methylase